MNAKILLSSDGLRLNVIGDNQSIRLTSEDTGGAFTLIEQHNDPGVTVPMHVHAREDETFHVVEGQMTFTVGDKQIVADAGTTVFLPRGVPHSFTSSGTEKSKVILILSPAGLERMFLELNDLPPGPPDFGKITEICGKYGITFL
jgi:quercetin dioxygenase-like cupin family protein